MSSQKQVLTDIFRRMDTDGNGTLDFGEVQRLLEKQGYREDRIKKFFNHLDTDGDQKVTLDEFLAGLSTASHAERKEASMRQVFMTFDKNGDGTVDKSELKDVFAEMGKNFTDQEIQRMMDMADLNKDGVLQYEEFVQHFIAHTF